MISILWKILYLAWIATEVLVLVMTRTRKSSGTVKDRGSLQLLWVTIVASISFASWFGEVHARTIFAGAHWVRSVALGIFALGLAIRWTAIVQLGRSFSVNVAIHEDQKLHRTGLFAIVRHPSYTGMMLSLAAISIGTGNWIAMAILMIPTTAALLYRIHVEEAALGHAFGGAYEEYSRTTKRLIPGIY